MLQKSIRKETGRVTGHAGESGDPAPPPGAANLKVEAGGKQVDGVFISLLPGRLRGWAMFVSIE